MNQPFVPTLPAFEAAWHGYGVMRDRPKTIAAEHAVVSAIPAGWQLELAGRVTENFDRLARTLFGATDTSDTQDAPPLEIHAHGDAEAGDHAIVAFAGDRLFGVLLVKRAPIAEGRAWLAARLGTPLDPAERFRLFSGRPGGAMAPRGDIVCFCCNVGRNEIIDAVRAGCATVPAIGARTRAGINCGRCRPDLEGLIAGAIPAGAV